MKEGHSLQTTTFKPTPIGPKTSFSEETRTELSGSETFQECLRVYAKSPQGSSLEQQAIGRAHRLGQTKTVIAKRYLTPDSIEEKMLALKEKKQLSADQLLEGQEEAFNWTSEDLLHLLS